MTVRRVALLALLVGGGALAAASCGDGDTTAPPEDDGPPAIASVEVAPASETLTALGAQATFEATARDSDGNEVPGASVSWSSSDPSVATVDGSGTVTAEGDGEATITATADGASGTASVTVDQQAASVTVSPDSGSVSVDETVRFEAEAADANGNPLGDPAFAWSSSNTDVATVDSTGLVAGENEGTADIAAEVDGAADTSVVNVTAPVASITVTPDSAGATALGETEDFAATALDAGGGTISGVSFTWSTSDADVATVDGSGVATARGQGSATITASAGGASGSAIFTVDQEVSGVTVSPDSAGVTVGDTTRYDAESRDANGNAVADADVAWSSSDTDVATVDGTGLVTAEAEGSAEVIAESEGVADSAIVVVAEQAAGSVSAVSGGGQHGVTTRAYDDSLVVEVTDGAGDPVSGVAVDWSVASGDATFSGTGSGQRSTTTGDDGRARVEVTAGTSTGPVTVEATVDGRDGSPVSFDLDTSVALVLVGDIFFEDPNGRRNEDASVSIAVGDTVMWEWMADLPHTVTSTSTPEGGDVFDSGQKSSGTFRFAPSTEGLWEYFCEVHPNTMTGTEIEVSGGDS